MDEDLHLVAHGGGLAKGYPSAFGIGQGSPNGNGNGHFYGPRNGNGTGNEGENGPKVKKDG